MKLNFCEQINKGFLKVNSITLGCVAKYAKSSQNKKFVISLQYLNAVLKNEVDFCLQINIKGFFRLLQSFQVCMARHAQNTKNYKSVISLQYVMKEVSDEVDFLHVDKH